MAKVGDRVSLDAKKVGQVRRCGVVLKVSVGLSGERLEIRWDDESTSIIAPAAGSLLVEGKAKAKKAKAKSQKAKTKGQKLQARPQKGKGKPKAKKKR